jgi:hypothetical protein
VSVSFPFRIVSGLIGHSPEETIAALSLISKRSPEPLNLGSIGKGLAGIIAGLAGSQVAQGVLGDSDNSQRDLT